MAKELLIHASEIVSGQGIRKKDGRRVGDDDLARIEDGAIVYTVSIKGKPGKIEWVGPTSEIPKKYLRFRKKNLKGKKAVIPGLVDCHTHIIFAGDRSSEFAERCAGASYEEIAARGGGILSTVRSTREASVDELVELGVNRIRQSKSLGVQTIEIKSGYGLSVEDEVKSLRAIKRLKKEFPELTIVSTFLGAHAFPLDVDRKEYLRQILEEMLPQVADENLAEACDVFIDRGYFTLEEGREILACAKKLGLQIKLHGDELADTSSASLAAEMKALSVDHLLKVSKKGIRDLASSQTVAVLLPGTAFFLKEKYAPARELIDAGACVAVATDFNPGSCMCNNLPFMMNLSALYMGMTRAEILASVTYNAAKALGLESRKGTIETGMDADFTVIPFKRFEETFYELGWVPSR